MNTIPLFSLIIPVYNVEKYLNTCLNSILIQSFSDYEIILVNDGSTDSSGEICDSYAKKNSHIVVIEKINGGLSSARNAGIEKAKGKYIWFIDSDDWIFENSLSVLKEHLQFTDIDVISFSYVSFQEDLKKYSDFKYRQNTTILTGNEFFTKIKSFHPAVWVYVYNHDFIKNNQLRFEDGLIHEDVYFNLNYLGDVKQIKKIPDPLYYHRIRSGSIMKDSSNENLAKRILSYIKILELCYRLKDRNEAFMERNINLYKITFFEILYIYTLRNVGFNSKYKLLKKSKKTIKKMPVTASFRLINIMKIVFNNSVLMFYILRRLTSNLNKLKSN
ncbi:MAG: glycosyltransferase [Algibacter sp.]